METESLTVGFITPAFRLGSSTEHFIQRPLKSNRSPSPCLVHRRVMTASAQDELKTIVPETLGMGKVTSMTRAGSSGWAAMHRVVTENGNHLFVKVSRQDESMFQGETKGLWAMHETNTIVVPKPFKCGTFSSVQASYIIMEELDLVPVYSQLQLGTKLAEMHLATPVFAEAQQGMFGFPIDNTIGSTPQPNGWMSNWIDFFREKRLRHQLLLTGDSTLMEKGSKLCLSMHHLFEDLKGQIKPSLLHGDLWSGNISGVDGVPALFDPACYYGHHEAEFGMSWCAGLGPNFWDAYDEVIPRQPGFAARQKLYQLYHYLNHYNLFGGGYYNMSELLLNDLLREVS